MKFAICNEVFEGWAWERTCQRVAQIGYDGIELAPFTLADDVRSIDPAARSDVRAVAERAGLEITGLHWLLVSPKGLSLTTPDPSVRAETASYLTALVDFCADIGGSVLTLGSPKQRWVSDGGGVQTAVDRFCDALRPCLDRAAERGQTLCIEPLPPPESNFLLTLDEVGAVLDRLDHPAVRTIFDVKSASWEGKPLPEIIARHAPRFAHAHANDTNLRGPGFGETDFGPVLDALAASGFSGYVSVEPFDYRPDPETVAVQSLEYLRARASERNTR